MQTKDFLLAAVAAAVLFPALTQTASAQPYPRPYYEEGYRQGPPPPPPGYYEERRYYREAPPPGYGPQPGYGRPPQGYPPQQGYQPQQGYRQQPSQTVCAREGGFCAFRGEATVRYGLGGRWVTKKARDGIECGNRTFGDPAPGADKVCILIQ